MYVDKRFVAGAIVASPYWAAFIYGFKTGGPIHAVRCLLLLTSAVCLAVVAVICGMKYYEVK